MVVPSQRGVNTCVSLSGVAASRCRDHNCSSCISTTVGGDLIGATRWTGVSLKQILAELGLRANATHLKIHSADGFYEIVAWTLSKAMSVMLACAWDGLPLAPGTWLPTAHLYSRSVWDEAIQMDRIHRGGRSWGAGL